MTVKCHSSFYNLTGSAFMWSWGGKNHWKQTALWKQQQKIWHSYTPVVWKTKVLFHFVLVQWLNLGFLVVLTCNRWMGSQMANWKGLWHRRNMWICSFLSCSVLKHRTAYKSVCVIIRICCKHFVIVQLIAAENSPVHIFCPWPVLCSWPFLNLPLSVKWFFKEKKVNYCSKKVISSTSTTGLYPHLSW